MGGIKNKDKSAIRAAELDRIVATYAPIGARQIRRRAIRRTCIAGAAAVLAASSALFVASDFELPGASIVGSWIRSPVNWADDRRLAAERTEFEEKLAELERQIESVLSQKQDLDAQKAVFAEQSESLGKLLQDIGMQQAELERRQQQGSQLDHEIAAIATQRKALEQRWAQFEAQGELLAMEIVAVNAQRKELEGQRRQIDRQQRELAELLEKANGLYHRESSTADTEDADAVRSAVVDDNTIAYTGDSYAIGDSELKEMRGGFTVGDGLDVSFGFMQTGSINGVEQFTNNFTIDSMASGIDNVDLSNMNSVVLQNGSGNFVSQSVLDSLADSFGNVIQNTLDDQTISTTTIYDISLQNVPGTVQGMYGEQALIDTLGSF